MKQKLFTGFQIRRFSRPILQCFQLIEHFRDTSEFNSKIQFARKLGLGILAESVFNEKLKLLFA